VFASDVPGHAFPYPYCASRCRIVDDLSRARITTGGLGLIGYFESSAPFAVCFDDAYMGIDLPSVDVIFQDGFEDGSTDAWSATSP